MPYLRRFLAVPVLATTTAFPCHAEVGGLVGSLGLQLAFELGDNPAASIGFDFRYAAWFGDYDKNQGHPDAVGGFISVALVIPSGMRLMVGVDYAVHEDALGTGAQFGWFFRGRGHAGPETHGLVLGAFLRPEVAFELGANAFFSLNTLGVSMNTWLGGRLSSAGPRHEEF